MDGKASWSKTHAQIPTIYFNGEKSRVYYTTRDADYRSNISFVELDSSKLNSVSHVHGKPLLQLGKPGSFDSDGIMMSCLVEHNNALFLYYVGWNRLIIPSYNLSIGRAVSYDEGVTFEKCYDGPIMTRDISDPFFVAMPNIIIQNDLWKMWYISCTEWKPVGQSFEPVYLIKYAESKDGINWNKRTKPCIDYKYDGEALGRPSVIFENGKYKMWYSSRGSVGYRDNKNSSYRIGYAESENGVDWIRMDEEMTEFKISESGWDSQMMCYAHVADVNKKRYMVYNGNGFGKTGFGLAIYE